MIDGALPFKGETVEGYVAGNHQTYLADHARDDRTGISPLAWIEPRIRPVRLDHHVEPSRRHVRHDLVRLDPDHPVFRPAAAVSTLEGGARVIGSFWPASYFLHLGVGTFTKGRPHRAISRMRSCRSSSGARLDSVWIEFAMIAVLGLVLLAGSLTLFRRAIATDR